jgi:hypothetical protein
MEGVRSVMTGQKALDTAISAALDQAAALSAKLTVFQRQIEGTKTPIGVGKQQFG